MKKLLFTSSVIGVTAAFLTLSGCQQLQKQAQDLQNQGQKTFNGLSQQAEGVKTQVLQTKAAFDEKSQEAVNTMNDFNKLTK